MRPRRRPLDVAIVGAGPAGLAAACALRASRPLLRVAVFDRGGRRSPRDATPTRLVQGVGGAGLWSDGKFSWAPSATRLWELPDVERAYDAVVARVRAVAPAGATARTRATTASYARSTSGSSHSRVALGAQENLPSDHKPAPPTPCTSRVGVASRGERRPPRSNTATRSSGRDARSAHAAARPAGPAPTIATSSGRRRGRMKEG